MLTCVRRTAVSIAHSANCKFRSWDTARLKTAETATLKARRSSTACAPTQCRSHDHAFAMRLILSVLPPNVNAFYCAPEEDDLRAQVEVACATRSPSLRLARDCRKKNLRPLRRKL